MATKSNTRLWRGQVTAGTMVAFARQYVEQQPVGEDARQFTAIVEQFKARDARLLEKKNPGRARKSANAAAGALHGDSEILKAIEKAGLAGSRNVSLIHRELRQHEIRASRTRIGRLVLRRDSERQAPAPDVPNLAATAERFMRHDLGELMKAQSRGENARQAKRDLQIEPEVARVLEDGAPNDDLDGILKRLRAKGIATSRAQVERCCARINQKAPVT